MRRLANATRSVRGGRGQLVLLEGELGAGKSRMLDHAMEAACLNDMRILSAAGQEHEREFRFGLARRLFEGPSLPLMRRDVQETVDGDAWRAPDELLIDELFRVTAELAAEAPLVLAVDDVHEADVASLRLLLYLAQRLEQLPVLMLIASRRGAAGGDGELLEGLAMHHEAERIELAPLRHASVCRLVRHRFGDSTGEALGLHVWRVTRGNPLFLHELCEEIARRGAVGVEEVARLAPRGVSYRLGASLSAIGADAQATAQAIAILGEEATLRHAVALTGRPWEAVARAVDSLARSGLLLANGTLAFSAPMIRTCVYEGLSSRDRASGHATAARLLRQEAEPVERVAQHLLHAPALGDREAADILAEAGDRALARGEPGQAASYLRRALTEPPPRESRPDVLVALGEAEAASGQPGAIDRMVEAIELIDDRCRRAEVLLDLSQALYARDRREEAARSIRRGLSELEGVTECRDLRLRLDSALVTVTRFGLAGPRPISDRLPAALASHEDEDGLIERVLIAHLAFELAMRGEPRDEVVRLAYRALGGGRLLEEETSDGMAFYLAASALHIAEDVQGAEAVLTMAIEDARERGSVLALSTASHARAGTILRRGRVTDVIADARRSLSGVTHGWRLALPGTYALLADALLESGRAEEAASTLASGEAREFADSPYFGCWLTARGNLHLHRSDFRAARNDFIEAGKRQDALGAANPAVLPWRSKAALAAHRLGDSAAARDLAEQDLDLARRFGARGALGRALRTLGRVAGGREGLGWLEEAVAVLAPSQCKLEYAEALVELGSARRRAGHPEAARGLLHEGLALAERCGSERLAGGARDERRAAGAKPRRLALDGVDSLTAREREVAELAADGLSNREVAESLFVTRKTVEWHLSNVFMKLGIGSREELSKAIAPEAGSPQPTLA